MAHTADGYYRIALQGEMTIYTAHECKKQLLEPLHDEESIEVDLTSIEVIDTVGIQLLLLVEREARAKKKYIRFQLGNPVVEEALSLCRLTSNFIPSQQPQSSPSGTGAAI